MPSIAMPARLLLVCLTLTLFASAARADQVADLVAKLDSAVGDELYATVDDLGRLGAAAAPASPQLIEMLGDDDVELRRRAARALGAVGPAAQNAVGPLAASLKDEDALVRAQSAFALGLMGEAGKAAAPQLAAAVGDEDALVRRAALRAIHRLKPDREVTRPLFLRILKTSDPLTVSAVLHSMAELGADAVPALADAMEHEEARYWATLVVQEIGPPAKSLVPQLTEMATDDDEPELRMHAILALGAIGDDAKESIPVIVGQLQNDKYNAAKYAAAYVLPNLKAKEAKNALQAAVDNNKGDDGDLFLRLVSARGLALLFPEDEALQTQSVESIIEGIQSEDKNIRRAAVQSLAETKAPSDEVQPKLIAAIEAADQELISDVIRALSAMGAEAVPRVTRGLSNPKLRGYAAVILGNIGADAKAAVPELTTALDVDDDPEFRREVLFTLGQIGPPSAPAVKKMINILQTDDNERVVAAACYALRNIGPAASEAGPALVGVYNDGTEFQRMVAIWALLKVRPGHDSVEKRAIPLLTKGLSSDRAEVRAEAAQALGQIGPKSASALPELKKLLNDPDPIVKSAATAAVAAIQG